MNIHEIGRYGRYTFEDGETATDWLYGELPDEVLELHRDVFEELERVEILDLVQEVQERLPRISPRYLLPLVDAAGNYSDNAFEWLERPWSFERHRSLLDEVLEQRAAQAFL